MREQTRTKCSLCRGTQFDDCGKLPSTPLANEFVSIAKPYHPYETYPLELLMCRTCNHVQLACLVDPAKLFSEYLYETSTSQQTINHLRKEANAVAMAIASPMTAWKEKPRVLEIGSNDGAFLKELMKLGFHQQDVLGIEPSNTMSERAIRDGVPTIKTFFGPQTRSLIPGRYASIVANNVLAHVPSVRDVLEEIAACLLPGGILVMEVGGAADIFRGAFDVIYHEHTSYHTLQPLRRALEAVGVPMFDVQRSNTEVGRGSLRIWAGQGRQQSKQMMDELVREEDLQLDDLLTWRKILGKGKKSVVAATEDRVSSFFSKWYQLRKNPVIVGYGAPAKLTTLSYACKIPKIAAVIDDSPWKIGKCTPGNRIPIVGIDEGLAMNPDAIIAFAWNFADAVAKKLEDKGYRGELFVPLPEGKTIRMEGKR